MEEGAGIISIQRFFADLQNGLNSEILRFADGS